jgi:hypothetical protein
MTIAPACSYAGEKGPDPIIKDLALKIIIDQELKWIEGFAKALAGMLGTEADVKWPTPTADEIIAVKKQGIGVLPPPEYDHPYAGNLQVIRGRGSAEMLRLCRRLLNSMAARDRQRRATLGADVGEGQTWTKKITV